MDLQDVAQNRDRWWDLCECGTEPSCAIKCGQFLEYLEDLLASQEGLYSMELVLYNGVCLIFVWLILSYECIYAVAYIMCNHSVLRSQCFECNKLKA